MSKRDGIRKVGTDRWEVRVSYGKDPVSGQYRRKSFVVQGKRADAERRKRELETAKDQHMPSPGEMTVEQLLDAFILSRELAGATPRTIHGHRQKRDCYLVPTLGSVPVQQLTSYQVEHAYQTIRTMRAGRVKPGEAKRPLSAQTVRLCHGLLSAALRRAVRQRVLPFNPADAAAVPKCDTKETGHLEPTEAKRMIVALEDADPRLRVACLLALTCGLRKAEVCGLRWGAVNLREHHLNVDNAVVYVPGLGNLDGDPKTAQSRRQVPLPDVAVRALEALRGPVVSLSGTHYVLGSNDGKPWSPNALDYAFRCFREAHHLDVTFHGLRHTFATLQLDAGEGLDVVKDLLGHSTITLTVNTYRHRMSDQGARTAGNMDRLFGTVSKRSGRVRG